MLPGQMFYVMHCNFLFKFLLAIIGVYVVKELNSMQASVNRRARK